MPVDCGHESGGSQSTVAQMSVEQRLEIAALIAHLNRAADPEYQAELDRRMAAMEAGRKHPQADLERRHKELAARGR